MRNQPQSHQVVPLALLSQNAICYSQNGDKVIPCITDEQDLYWYIWQLEKLTREIISSEGEVFWVVEQKRNRVEFLDCARIGRDILSAFKFDYKRLDKHFAKHEFNPFFRLFLKNMEEVSIYEKEMYSPIGTVWDLAEKLNAFVSAIRKEAKTPNFQKEIGDFRRLPNKNLSSLKAYIDSLFVAHEDLVVLRMDLGYKKSAYWPNEVPGPVSHAEVKEHQQALLKFLRTGLPNKPMVGYALNLGYSLDKGWNQHLMIFLDAAKVHGDPCSIYEQISAAWDGKITKGLGLFYYHAASDGSYRACGIGRINRDDDKLRDDLVMAAIYMIKPDYYCAITVPGNGRSFSKGVAPKACRTGKTHSKTVEVHP